MKKIDIFFHSLSFLTLNYKFFSGTSGYRKWSKPLPSHNFNLCLCPQEKCGRISRLEWPWLSAPISIIEKKTRHFKIKIIIDRKLYSTIITFDPRLSDNLLILLLIVSTRWTHELTPLVAVDNNDHCLVARERLDGAAAKNQIFSRLVVRVAFSLDFSALSLAPSIPASAMIQPQSLHLKATQTDFWGLEIASCRWIIVVPSGSFPSTELALSFK